MDLGKCLDLERDFDFGALFHLYLDYLWDNGPQMSHRKGYTGENWFLDYRKELKMAGSRAAQRAPWNREVWERLHFADPALYESILDLPKEEADAFLDYNYHWHLENALPESEVFTDARVDAFLARSLKAFHAFLRDFFPSVAQKHFSS